jgi:3-phenylpropionate/cinnamic acid dioxygenase small subunit
MGDGALPSSSEFEMDQHAEDHAEITALIHAYASLLDAGELDGVAALFEHASWRSATADTVLRGADQVRKVYSRVHLYDGTPRTKHLITNLSVDVEAGADTAAAQCSYTVLQGIVPGAPIQVILSGRYVDRFERVSGRWRFADRLVVVDLIGDQSRHFG